MTRTEEQAWHKKGRAYSDTFLDKVRVRQVLKKRKKAEESGTAVKLTKRQQFLDSYVDRLSQLESTCARLKRFPIFLSSNHAALERRGISRVSQFVYHVENYLAVIYIFDQRVRRLSGFIEKLAKKHSCTQVDVQNLMTARKDLVASVEPLVVIRGSHTHEKYFQDDQIDEMLKYDKASDFATILADKKIFKNLAKTSLTLQRRRWKKDINSDIHKCEIQMGVLYEALDKLVWQIYKKIK